MRCNFSLEVNFSYSLRSIIKEYTVKYRKINIE